jgi:hypothetical protein
VPNVAVVNVSSTSVSASDDAAVRERVIGGGGNFSVCCLYLGGDGVCARKRRGLACVLVSLLVNAYMLVAITVETIEVLMGNATNQLQGQDELPIFIENSHLLMLALVNEISQRN